MARALRNALNSPSFQRVVHQGGKFGVVGTANTATCLIVIWALHGFGAALWVASAAGYCVSIIQAYLLHRSWTFSASARASGVGIGKQIFAFLAVNATCGVIFTELNVAFHHYMSAALSSISAVIVVTPLNFVLSRWVVFRQTDRA